MTRFYLLGYKSFIFVLKTFFIVKKGLSDRSIFICIFDRKKVRINSSQSPPRTKIKMPETICQFTVYRNGNIYTMEDKDEDGKSKKVNCLAVSKPGFGGKIEYAGPYDDLPGYMKTKGFEYDLQGKTLMPGFIDPHVHPSMACIILNTKFITPLPWNLPGEKPGEIRRVEGTTSEAEYKRKIEEWIAKEC